MNTSATENELENARELFNQVFANPNRTGNDIDAAKGVVLSLERKLAAEKKEEYADTIDFPVKWDIGAPMPHLVSNGYRTFLFFYLSAPHLSKVEPIAFVNFNHCVSVKLGDPNEEVLHGHSLYGKGLEPYTAQIVRNSKWIKELQKTNKVHSQYRQDLWDSLNHYIFWFHDETFECIAKSYEIEVVSKNISKENMDEVIIEALKRLSP